MVIDWPEVNKDNSGETVWADVTRHCIHWKQYWMSRTDGLWKSSDDRLYPSMISYKNWMNIAEIAFIKTDPRDPMTTAHECTHGTNSDIRNKLNVGNGYYLLNNTAITIDEPNFRKSQINQFVPSNRRGLRYSQYLVGTREWDEPSYILDEWSAYTNGSLCAIEQKKATPNMQWSDWACGTLEFCIYSLAFMVACKKFSPKDFDKITPDFSIMWVRAWKAFDECNPLFPWNKQDTLLASYKQNVELQKFAEQFVVSDTPDFSSI
jgi:hypothetical protein